MNMEIAQTLRAPAPLIDEEMVEIVVETFYARIRRHPSLGPVLEAAIGDHWPEYLSKMRDYWTSVLLDTGRYHDNPILAHRQHKAIRPEHFDLWLELWRETVRDCCPVLAASEFIRKAEEIGESLKTNLYESPKSPTNDDNPRLADNAVARIHETNADRKMQSASLIAPAAEIHPRVFAIVLGAYMWMLFSLWAALHADGGAVFMIAISAFFLTMYAGIPFTLSALGRKHIKAGGEARGGFAAFLDRKIETYTGAMSGRDAMIQITIIPVLLALGVMAIAVIIVHAQS